jgi:hypothetical protein
MMSFDDMVKTILERGKVSRDELMSKIRQKQDELSGFITSEGAAIIVGRELGVDTFCTYLPVFPARIEIPNNRG